MLDKETTAGFATLFENIDNLQELLSGKSQYLYLLLEKKLNHFAR